MEGLIFAILWYIVVYIKSLNAAWTTICHIFRYHTPLRVMIFFKHSPFNILNFGGRPPLPPNKSL